MTLSYTARRRIRRGFSRIGEVTAMPNLIEIQKRSYDAFLHPYTPDTGLQGVFTSVFPISDFSETASLEFVKYELEAPKYDVDECRQRGMTFAAPLKVTDRKSVV